MKRKLGLTAAIVMAIMSMASCGTDPEFQPGPEPVTPVETGEPDEYVPGSFWDGTEFEDYEGSFGSGSCIDVTSYDNNWENDMLCTREDGSTFYTDYDGAAAFEASQ